MKSQALSVQAAIEFFYQDRVQSLGHQKACEHRNQIYTALYRYFLPALGKVPFPKGKKLTKAERERNDLVLSQLPLSNLLNQRSLIEKGFDVLEVTKNIRYTYGSKFRTFCDFAESILVSQVQKVDFSHQRCPRRLKPRAPQLDKTNKSGKHVQYQLQPEDLPPALAAQIKDYQDFLSAPTHPDRYRRPLAQSTLHRDFQIILGFCGWYTGHKTVPTPLESLSLETLIPVLSPFDLDDLPKRDQRTANQAAKAYLDAWLQEFFNFLREENEACTPNYHCGQLTTLRRVFWYLYRHEVDSESDYKSLVISQYLDQRIKELQELQAGRKRNQQTVTDPKTIWPETRPGESVLDIFRTQVTEPIRLECAPRDRHGLFIKRYTQARHLQEYLMMSFFTNQPSRRQQELCSLRICLSCPLERPDDVPPNGLYYPLPPNDIREKRLDGTVADNYLFRVYSHKGVSYPDGVWMIQICNYKTYQSLGVFERVLPNKQFEDGRCFEDYLHEYLQGRWYPSSSPRSQLYSGWDEKLQGKRGIWVTQGRHEFQPKNRRSYDVFGLEDRDGRLWGWGYFLLMPTTGKSYTSRAMTSWFGTSVQQFLPQIKPGLHLMRKVWATWGYQCNLSYAQMESLAFSMGHSLETLTKDYQKVTILEKLQPVNEAISRLLERDESLAVLDDDSSRIFGDVLPLFRSLDCKAQQLLLSHLRAELNDELL